MTKWFLKKILECKKLKDPYMSVKTMTKGYIIKKFKTNQVKKLNSFLIHRGVGEF